jgi:plasmid stabilization system protein ParE
MARLSYSPVALEMIGAIHRYIKDELENPTGADNTIRFIRDRLEILKISPEGGLLLSSKFDAIPDAHKDDRPLVCGNYIAIYRYENGMVKVLRVYHGARDYIRHLINAE